MNDTKKTGWKDDAVNHMVNRFLGWELPADFNPDGGITYIRPNYPPNVKSAPIGTNLFTAVQAEAMVRYMLEGALSSYQQRVEAEIAKIDSKYGVCTDPNCPSRKSCDEANYHIKMFKADLSEALDRITKLEI